jgi:hypothetical protein
MTDRADTAATRLTLRSAPATVSWGWIDADRPPVARVKSARP